MKLIRWLLCLPVGLVVGAAVSGLVVQVGDFLLGGWKVPSGVVIYCAAIWFPMLCFGVGWAVAPGEGRGVKWFLLSPHLLLALPSIPFLLMLLFSPESVDGLPADLSRSLSSRWQGILWSFGYLVGVVSLAAKDPKELVDDGKPSFAVSPAVQAMLEAYDRALRSPDPADRLEASREALERIEALEPWPSGAQLSRRVAHGTMLGVQGHAYWELRSQDPRSYTELAVERGLAAKRDLRPEDGETWTTLLTNLAVAYGDRVLGEEGDNLERALRYGEAALARRDRSADPEAWAQAATNLAGFHAQNPRGEPAENLERALELQHGAVEAFIESGAPPLGTSMALGILGSLYARRIAGSHRANLDRARTYLEQALEKIPRREAPLEWAHTAGSLASVYQGPSMIRRPAHADRALELLRSAGEIYADLGWKKQWAGIQTNLGTFWVESPTEDRLAAYDRAIHHFEAALEVFTADGFPNDHAAAAENLATARQGRRRLLHPQSDEEEIAEARRAVERIDRETKPREWRRATTNLGGALLASRDEALIEEALSCFRAARSAVSRESAPEEWAMATTHLANAYASRRRGDPAENLEEAIRLQEEALEALDPLTYPATWAQGVHNLALSYQERRVGSRADNIEMTLALVESALVVRTTVDAPEKRSELLELLGTAFLDRPRGDPEDNLERAIASYRSARHLRRRETSPAAWLRLEHKLLRAESLRESPAQEGEAKTGEEARRPSLEEFTGRMRRDLEAVSPEKDVITWAEGWITLGNLYRQSSPGSFEDFEDFRAGAVENQKKAAAAYRQALSAISERNEPWLWYLAHERLSSAHESLYLWLDFQRLAMPFDEHDPARSAADRREARIALQAAADAMAEGMKVHNQDPRQTLYGFTRLGRLYVGLENWDGARRAFAEAGRAAGALLADVEVSEAELKEILRSLGSWAELAPYAFVMMGDLGSALEAAEVAKARLIAKALTLEALDLPAEDRRRLEALQEEIQQHEARLVRPFLIYRAPPLEAAMRIREELRSYGEGAPEHDAAGLIHAVLEEGEVLVFPFLKAFPMMPDPTGCLVIAYRQGGFVRTASRVLGEESAGAHFWRSLGDPRTDWPGRYAEVQRGAASSTAAKRTLGGVRKALGMRFAGPLAELLDSRGIPPGARVRILPQGNLGALPLALAETSEGEVLLDRFEVSLVPSLRVLAAAKERRAAETGGRSLALVVFTEGEEGDGELEFAPFEAAAVESRFPAERVDRIIGEGATRESCLGAMERRTVWHFAAHGDFDAAAPLQSGIKLAGGETLTAADLLAARDLAKPSLVVLSACETGRYDEEDLPNEFIGLPAALLQAGAAGVIATLWRVHDVISTLVLSRFHELYAADPRRPSGALREAQLWLRDSPGSELRGAVRRWADESRLPAVGADRLVERIGRQESGGGEGAPPFASPAYWAAFVYYGA